MPDASEIQDWLKVLGTYGLAVFLVLFYVFKIHPTQDKARKELLESMERDKKVWFSMISNMQKALGQSTRPLSAQETRTLAELGLDRNKFALIHAICNNPKMFEGTDNPEERLESIARDTMHDTRSKWDDFVVLLGEYTSLGKFFEVHSEKHIQEGIRRVGEILRSPDLEQSERRKQIGDIIESGMSRARDELNGALRNLEEQT